uniref:Secreted protein n=1 Tax=Octopus bimaculoides TaxID=37653 RepID=A0A0L8HP21_OCTBM
MRRVSVALSLLTIWHVCFDIPFWRWRETHTHTYKHKEKQTLKQTHPYTHPNTHTYTQRQTHTHTHRDKHTHRHTLSILRHKIGDSITTAPKRLRQSGCAKTATLNRRTLICNS